MCARAMQGPSQLTPQQNEQVIARFRKMTDEKDALRNKVIELQQDAREHELVVQVREQQERRE